MPTPEGGLATSAQRPAPLHTVVVAIQVLRGRGISVETLLDGSGITTADLALPDAMITHSQELIVFSNALDASCDTSIGLTIGNAIPLTAYGIRGHAMLVSPDLRTALELGFSLPLLAISYFNIALRTEGNEAVVTIDGYSYRPDLLVMNTDMCVAAIKQEITGLLGRPPVFTRMSVVYPRPAHADAYAPVFGCPIEFGAARNTLVFDAALLDTPLPLAHPLEFEKAVQRCMRKERELAMWTPSDIVARALRVLYEDPAAYGAAELAQALGMSHRSLQRKLEESRTSFKTLQEHVRRDLALRYLESARYSVKEIAHRVGYSSTSSFSRALRRWRSGEVMHTT